MSFFEMLLQGGFKTVTNIDRFRLTLTKTGILVVFAFALSIAFRNIGGFTRFAEVISTGSYGFGNLSILFVVSLAVVNIPWQLVDMSVWQRICACRNVSDVRKGIKQTIFWIGLSWVLLIVLGMSLLFFPSFYAPIDGDFAKAFLLRLENPWVFSIFSMGCFAAMLSTADSLLLASVQTIAVDIMFPHKNPNELFCKKQEEVTNVDRMLLSFGRRWVLVLGIASPIMVYLISLAIPAILDLFFLIFSAQLTLLVSVLIAIFNKRPEQYSKISIISISLGLLTAFIIFIKMIINPTSETFLWAPILSLFASIIPWFFAVVIKK